MRGAFYTSASPSPFGASDFTLFNFATGAADPLQHPNFSSTGGAIDFGFAARFNLTSATPFALNGVFRFDNVVINVNGVPEPSVLLLVGLALGVALLPVRRRQFTRRNRALQTPAPDV